MNTFERALTAAFVATMLSLAPEPQAPAKSSARVEATFVDHNGRPISGVTVISRIWPGAESTAESDSRGRFEIVLEWDPRRDGTWYAGQARKKGFALREFRTDLRSGQAFDFGRLTLDPGGVLTGRVHDESGAALANAMILVVDATKNEQPPTGKQDRGPDWANVTDRGLSNESGQFEIIGVPPGEWYVAAKHESSWWHFSRAVTLPVQSSVQVPPVQLNALPDEYRIAGRVLDPDGKGVAEAEVSTTVWLPEELSGVQTTTTTDESGQFVLFLARLPEGTVELRVRPSESKLDHRTLANVRPGARDVTVQLTETLEIRLHVVDAQGLPVERFGWNLTIWDPNSLVMTGSASEPHADGYATLQVPEHPFDLEIRSDGHNSKKLAGLVPGRLPKVLEIRLTSSAAISGFVTSEGAPVSGAFVELVQRTPNYLKGVVEGHWNGLYYGTKRTPTYTDEQGRFRIPNDFPHLTYYARAWTEGYAEGLSGPVHVGAAGIQVELGTGGEVAGTLRLPSNLSPEGIELEFYRQDFKANSHRSSVGKILRTTTDSAGRYSMPHLAPGTWLIRIQPSGTLASDLGWSQTKRESEAHPHIAQVVEQETTFLDVALGADEPCVLEGRLSVGDKIQQGYCELLTEGRFALDLDFAGLDEQGRFRLEARAPGTYRLVIKAGPGHHQYKAVTDLVELVPGTTLWERDLAEELWVGEGIRLDREAR